MPSSFGRKVVLVSLVAPLLIAAKCDRLHVSMGSDGGTGGGQNGPVAGSKSGGAAGLTSGGSGGSENEPVAGSNTGGVAGSTDGGSGGSCESYRDDVSGTAPAVTVRVTNAGDSTIHFGPSTQTCDGSMPYFEIELAPGGEPRNHWQSRCESSCEKLRSGVAGCLGHCPFTPVIRLAPGASHDFAWTGTFYDLVSMPARCSPGAGPTASDFPCSLWFDAPDGTYVFGATAYPESVCERGACSCRDDEDACVMQGQAFVRGAPVSRTATLEYPAGNVVEIVFD